MALSLYQKQNLEKLKERARKLYREGLSLRDVGKIVKRSYQWVWVAVKEKDLTSNDN